MYPSAAFLFVVRDSAGLSFKIPLKSTAALFLFLGSSLSRPVHIGYEKSRRTGFSSQSIIHNEDGRDKITSRRGGWKEGLNSIFVHGQFTSRDIILDSTRSDSLYNTREV